uniref:Uncharacterized protein n=1 Tax=Arundo donax TaxID=35708 RepID=A0A0A9FNC0_ARUDO
MNLQGMMIWCIWSRIHRDTIGESILSTGRLNSTIMTLSQVICIVALPWRIQCIIEARPCKD